MWGKETPQEQGLRSIAAARGVFEDAIRRALATDGTLTTASATLIANALGSDDQLSKLAKLAVKGQMPEVPKGQFEVLREAVEATGPKALDPDEAGDQAEAISRGRAFVLPRATLHQEARAMLSDLRDWGIPEGPRAMLGAIVEEKLKTEVPPGNEGPARNALATMLEEYDYWSGYVDSFFPWSRRIGVGFCALAIISTVAALIAVYRGMTLFGYECAAVAGTSTSIATKLSGVSVYGEYAVLLARYAARLAAGIVGAMIGLALLSVGVINLSLGDTKLADVVSACVDPDWLHMRHEICADLHLCASEDPVTAKASGVISIAVRDLEVELARAQELATAARQPTSADGGAVDAAGATKWTTTVNGAVLSLTNARALLDNESLPRGDKLQKLTDIRNDVFVRTDDVLDRVERLRLDKSFRDVLDELAIRKDGNLASPCPKCSATYLLILLAVGTLLGFSERTLASFESALFGSSNGQKPSSPAAPPGGGPPSSDGRGAAERAPTERAEVGKAAVDDAIVHGKAATVEVATADPHNAVAEYGATARDNAVAADNAAATGKTE